MFPGTIEIHGDDIFRGTNKLYSSRLEQPTILIYLKYFIRIGNISISVVVVVVVVVALVLDRYWISVNIRSWRCSIGEYDISVCAS